MRSYVWYNNHRSDQPQSLRSSYNNIIVILKSLIIYLKAAEQAIWFYSLVICITVVRVNFENI